MAGAPKGNKNATGNSGGKPFSEENRKKAATLKGLVIDYAQKILKGKRRDKEALREKKEIVLRILPSCFPREVKVGGDKDNPIFLQITGMKISKDKND